MGTMGTMSSVTKASAKLLHEALALSTEERMDLAAELLASVDGPADPAWEAAWQAEIDRRVTEADACAEVRARVLSPPGDLVAAYPQ